MRKEHGQASIEFALMAPIVCVMIFGMIYGGIMFIEYLHFSNQVRTVARQIATTDASERKKANFIKGYTDGLTAFYEDSGMPKMYKPTVSIGSSITEQTGDEGSQNRTFNSFDDSSEEVVIEVSFVMEDAVYESLPNILKDPEDVSYGVGFPPKNIRTIQYHMSLEK